MFETESATRHLDVAVLGAGPAGLAMARSLARSGARVSVVDPHPTRRWLPNYACWEAELDGLEEMAAVTHRWAHPTVWLDDHPTRLGPAYVKVDTARLQHHLLGACSAAGVRFTVGMAAGADHHPTGSALRLADGRPLHAAVVVDATGYSAKLVERVGTAEPAYQSAYGELVEVAEHPYGPGEMAMMDYRPVDGAGPPSFLYALPLSPTHLFVEETVLASRPAMDHEALRRRLGRRLAALGIRPVERLERELCLIPMGTSLPRRRQRVVAFGAAASLVHPATGYQLARTLRLAPEAADAILRGLTKGPERASRAAYETIWPSAQLRAWELYRFGLDFLVGLDGDGIRSFLEAFFQLPESAWLGFMTGTLSPTAIATAMLGVFRNARTPLQSQLIRAGTGFGSKAFLRAALPQNPL